MYSFCITSNSNLVKLVHKCFEKNFLQSEVYEYTCDERVCYVFVLVLSKCKKD